MQKYFNDAIVGNKNMLASYTKKGELLRLFYPQRDYRQYLDFFHVGIRVNDSGLMYLHADSNNQYVQYYTEGTNILNTEIYNTYFRCKILQTDFVPIKEDILVKQYVFRNENIIDLDLDFLVHSKLHSDDNNDVSGFVKDDIFMQYAHDFVFCVASDATMTNSQINNTKETIMSGKIGDKDYIGMSQDSSSSYYLGVLKPGEERKVNLYLYFMQNVNDKKIKIKSLNVEELQETTRKYWRKYLKEHDTLHRTQITDAFDKKVESVYIRTILLYPLLINYQTGGISSGVEIDEKKTKCGRYSYCWPRDSIFITKAFDILGMEKETEKYYKMFCKMTQSEDGRWEQRFYTDGKLAPCWGYQIDETAAVVYGVYSHYEDTLDEKFLKDNLKMCEMAISYLQKYSKDVLEGIFAFQKSYDLWEENEGVHTYSLASIFAAFESMLKIYDVILPLFEKNRIKQEQIRREKLILENYLLQIKEYIIKTFYSEEKKSFVRSDDGKMDISLLGLVTPFHVFSGKEKKILNTIERMNLTIRTYTGGYLRYENDNYAGGNPWVIANLWLAAYYLEIGKEKEARECFDFAVTSGTEHGFLGEQVDNKTGKPAWVIGLGWSHAMFVIVLKRLLEGV